jgi:hypothetical protein
LRGGGLYACGFAVTFVVLEANSFFQDFKEIGLLLDGKVVEFVLNFIIDSFNNTIEAFMWPLNIIEFAPPWGAVGLGVTFLLFPKYLKKPIEAWLFSDDDPEELADKDSANRG